MATHDFVSQGTKCRRSVGHATPECEDVTAREQHIHLARMVLGAFLHDLQFPELPPPRLLSYSHPPQKYMSHQRSPPPPLQMLNLVTFSDDASPQHDYPSHE
jgi:hypothetical protein